MRWTCLVFGRHKGKTLPQIVFADPDWFFWAVEDMIFHNKGELAEEAREIYLKSRHIHIPAAKGEDLVAEYVIHPLTGTFADMKIVPRNHPIHEGASSTFRTDKIDLSVPRQIASYDKLGCKNLLRAVKYHLFGNSSYQMTRSRCERFFEADRNFDIDEPV